MKKIIWCSRHPLTEGQLSDLKSDTAMGEAITHLFEGEFPTPETENLLWAGSADWHADLTANVETWTRLIDWDVESRSQQCLITGVFPPVALEALAAWRRSAASAGAGEDEEVIVMTPVSAQSAVTRADGTKAIEFSHVRWAYL